MAQATIAQDDVFERALIRLLDPSGMPGARNGTVSAGRRRPARRMRADGKADDDTRAGAQITIVEILSRTSVSVRWSDPRSGHFGEQVWHCVIARTSSRCVLTGVPINRGDRVYRPRGRGRTVPCNWDRMIHAAAVTPLPASDCPLQAASRYRLERTGDVDRDRPERA
jgi:hypothetical protein